MSNKSLVTFFLEKCILKTTHFLIDLYEMKLIYFNLKLVI
jgi:hypothetical protein